MSDRKQVDVLAAPTVKKASIRHIEKRRTSTCRFADRVAQVSVDHFRKYVPQDPKIPTCLATIVAHDKGKEETGDGTLQVLSMGVGTKFLSESTLQEEEQARQYGRRVRDCHAEVLARRAFRRYVTLELMKDLQQQETQHAGQENHSQSSTKIFMSSSNESSNEIIQYKLKPSITLHLYTSSAPCGNATLKRFSKMQKERFREDLGPDEWPTARHEPIHGHSMKLGQFALLVKKDNSFTSMNKNVEDDAIIQEERQGIPTTNNKKRPSSCIERNLSSPSLSPKPSKNKGKKKKAWPATLSDEWCPPGTSIVSFRKGSIHTCSDKICRWNVLGIQGALLASLLESPLYVSTLTVGRKLTECICRRAICCRIGVDNYCTDITKGTFSIVDNTTTDPRRQGQQKHVPIEQQPIFDESSTDGYWLHHPAIMGTSVYMDETGVIQNAGPGKDNDETFGQDVRFHSSLCWAWWSSSDETKNLENRVEESDPTKKVHADIECVDGATGFAVPHYDNGQAVSVCADKDFNEEPSRVSTFSLVDLFAELHIIAKRRSQYSGACSGESNSSGIENTTCSSITMLKPESKPKTLLELRNWKKRMSPDYEAKKDEFLTKQRIFRHWNRREKPRDSPKEEAT